LGWQNLQVLAVKVCRAEATDIMSPAGVEGAVVVPGKVTAEAQGLLPPSMLD
jgi:hypothetical protein